MYQCHRRHFSPEELASAQLGTVPELTMGTLVVVIVHAADPLGGGLRGDRVLVETGRVHLATSNACKI